MNQLHMWQIAVDLALVATLLMISVRWLKSRAASDLLPKTMELENSLRGLLREADSASNALTSQLRERQTNLERLLKDLTATEERILATTPQIEERESQLQKGIREGERVVQQLLEVIQQIDENDTYSEPELIQPRTEPPAARASQKSARSQPLPESEIGRPALRETTAPASKQQQPKTAPSAAQERRKTPPAGAYASADGKRSIGDMQRVYAHAEELLKAGHELRQVSVETALPEEEVRLLSQMIEIETDAGEDDIPVAVAPTQRDSRLGVLGGMRRQTQTV